MKKTLIIASMLSSAFLFTACSSNPTQTQAIQKPNNQYEVTGLGKSQIISKNNAIGAANNACGKKATPIVIDEKVEFNGALKGVFDEQTGKMITAAAGVLGSVIGKGGIEKDTDYQTTLTFTCQANA
ncbi:hypothetical protein ACFODO_22405 [Acinetobacter sichuanensis]|uniref:Uncharacterized protein n=1 Tax=Acinetobacter sichuanensis TaxID=2136183 RepID=A0A371YSM7_9GAMM|nr:hypothetical protein [Acinetobacter sichuanensis]RFC84452.1 hypothetical protein C9E89_005850 [Acinetobacter sichuanensis]